MDAGRTRNVGRAVVRRIETSEHTTARSGPFRPAEAPLRDLRRLEVPACTVSSGEVFRSSGEVSGETEKGGAMPAHRPNLTAKPAVTRGLRFKPLLDPS